MYFYIFICQRGGDSHHPGGHQDGGQEAGAGDQQQHQQPEVPLQGVPLTRPGVPGHGHLPAAQAGAAAPLRHPRRVRDALQGHAAQVGVWSLERMLPKITRSFTITEEVPP